MTDLVIQSPTGRDVTTSLIVAQVFGKEHRNVLRDIENLSCSDNFRALNFEQTPYVHPQNGQTYKMYEMTKDGFSFLVMGYTGDKAGQFKEMFINEFNKREMMLKNDDYILARSQEILNKRLQLAEQQLQIVTAERDRYQEEVKTLTPKAKYTDEVLQSTSTYTMTQVAKEFGYSANTFAKRLRAFGVMFLQSGHLNFNAGRRWRYENFLPNICRFQKMLYICSVRTRATLV